MSDEETVFKYLIGQSKIDYNSEGCIIYIKLWGYGKNNYKYVLDKILEIQEEGKKIHYRDYENARKGV